MNPKRTDLITTHALTPDRWRDFSTLMNARFDTRHCWCMWPRLATSYKNRAAASNRRSMMKAVDTAKAPPGVLAYVDGVPAGWCAVAPRSEYPRLDRSHATVAVDDEPVWSIVCFLVRRDKRRQGLSRTLLSAAVELAAQHGAELVEGYPVDGGGDPFHGVASVFSEMGFKEVARRRQNRPIMRYRTRPARKPPPARSRSPHH